MTVYGSAEMDSYQYSQFVASIPCYVCGGGNLIDSQRCRSCQAPMALAHRFAATKQRPRLLALVGPGGAGKTVYLGVLGDMLARSKEPLAVFARGAYSLAVTQQTMTALSSRRFPHKTPEDPEVWHWVNCQVPLSKRKSMELIAPDLSGDAILREIEQPHSFPLVAPLLARSSAAIVMADAAALAEGVRDSDFACARIVNYLCDLDSHKRNGWSRRPVAIVFFKADGELDVDDAAEFAQRFAPSLYQSCQGRLTSCAFFSAGVAGACVDVDGLSGVETVPLRVEPHGIIEPFQWLIERIK